MSSVIDNLKNLQTATQPDRKEEFLKNAREDIEQSLEGFVREVAGYVSNELESKPSVEAPAGESRQTWKNHTANQVVQPLQYLHPKTYQELLNIVNYAKANNLKVKAIGSGHSFSRYRADHRSAD